MEEEKDDTANVFFSLLLLPPSPNDVIWAVVCRDIKTFGADKWRSCCVFYGLARLLLLALLVCIPACQER